MHKISNVSEKALADPSVAALAFDLQQALLTPILLFFSKGTILQAQAMVLQLWNTQHSHWRGLYVYLE